ncbi:ATP-binding protein [Aureitalea sp. L0-47]|uniref:ATP-binding protein n=1 Tax=Aureitalea sp. L0-47 TaxID=2816962 RepID=UPI002238AA97|nr:ATP-binding protein [Aureitalea sp. L0-47]MCW5519051.1 ATP-binding protein [Aureitalea sp. L0-47]
MEIIKKLADSIGQEIVWFEAVANTALTLYFQNNDGDTSIYDHKPPAIDNDSAYAELIRELDLGFEDRLLLILALIPVVKPQALDVFLIRNQNLNSEFSEFGGIKNSTASGFVPSLETACFLLSGNSLEERLRVMNLFQKDHVLYRIGALDYDAKQEFGLRQPLRVSYEYLGLLTEGKKRQAEISAKFPARQISTELEWEDLVVDKSVLSKLDEIRDYLVHGEQIMDEWQLNRYLKKGLRALFYGPSGTGKTLAASLIGKATNRPVFRVDLSLLVSKYIGETEKNLGLLFNEAENKDWILFFDEADALFGRRTQTKSSNDRYANQEIAYLLQRIEDFSGLVILATNIQTNIDEAFTRRFQAMVHFPTPGKRERLQLWEKYFKNSFELGADVDLNRISEDFELSGGEILNVLRHCALVAARSNTKKINQKDILTGIRKEYKKSNKTL